MEEGHAEGISSTPLVAQMAAWKCLVALLFLSTAIHVWTIAHTAVPARDTIGYIRYALLLERLPWAQGLRTLEQHPLYPASVLAVSLPIRYFEGTTPEAMVLASQLVSALAGVLLVVPMFYLGWELFDRRCAFWGTLLFQFLPIGAQVTSDGLSDALFLLMLTTALLWAVRGMRTQSAFHFALAGVMTGLAYLTRPEGAFVAVAALLVLGGVQALARARWPWRRAFAGAASLLTGAAVIAGPYMLVIGGITVKPGARKILLNVTPLDTLGENAGPGKDDQARRNELPFATGAPLLAVAPLGVWWMDEQRGTPPPITWGIKALLLETSHAFHYVGWVPALLGLWWYRGRFRQPPAWVMLVLCVLLSMVLVRVATGIHYLSERHALVLTVCGCLWAGAALVHIADRLPEWTARLLCRPLAHRVGTVLAWTWLVLAVAWCLPATLKPLHANRIGHREAGRWLAENVGPLDAIVDPYCWAHFYSGRLLAESRRPDHMDEATTQFVVLTQSKNPHARLFAIDKARDLAEQGNVVFRWTPTPEQRHRYRAEEVVVYAVPGSSGEDRD